METSNIIFRIKNCIRNSHTFSKNLGESTSIHRDYIINSLSDISSTEIHIALLEMKERQEIEISDDNANIILLTDNFK